ncbi:MAG TPA: tetratricopeptide repeat protein, partial [Planctomycetota bacterium]|nr:tetratricopeptide repeat protein [Planctomycetota bacterium]
MVTHGNESTNDKKTADTLPMGWRDGSRKQAQFGETTCRLVPGDAGSTTSPDQAEFLVACETCGFEGHDRSFTAFPGEAFRSPGALLRFAQRQWTGKGSRVCPLCGGDAEILALQLRLLAPSLGGELLLRLRTEPDPAEFLILAVNGTLKPVPMGDARLLDACMDSCVRGGVFLGSVSVENIPAALKLLTLAREARPNDPLPLLWMCRLHLNAEQTEEALRHLKTVRPLVVPGSDFAELHAEVLADLGLATEDDGLIHAAMEEYRRLLRQGPRRQHYELALGRLLVQKGKFADARPLLEAATKDPTLAFEAFQLQGLSFLEGGDPSRALPIFQKLVKYAPNDPLILQSLAWCLFRTGQAASAEKLVSACDE